MTVHMRVCGDGCGARLLSAKIVMFKVLPGKVYHCERVEMGRQLEDGHDSHESPHSLEWWLPLEGQSCPMAVLTVRAHDRAPDGGGDLADDQ